MTRNTSFTRGETFVAWRIVRSGAFGAGATCRMALKPSRNGSPPPDDVPIAAELTVVWADHVDQLDDTSPPGFVGTLSAEQSADLPPVWYSMDATIQDGAFVEKSDPIRVEVKQGVG